MSKRPSVIIPGRCPLCRFGFGEDGMIVIGVQSVGYHAQCFKLVPPESRSALIKAAAYQFQPSPVQEERRNRWLRRNWGPVLFRALPLPLELCDHIAQYCLPVFAVLSALAPWGKSRQSTSWHHSIRLSTRVWARYTWYEGVRYVASLTNQPPPDDVPSVELVFDPSLVDPIFVNTIFVVEDHLGIRELAFRSSDEMQTIIQERPDIWGRVVHVPSLGSTLKSETDGMKLRTLKCVPEPPDAEPRSWDMSRPDWVGREKVQEQPQRSYPTSPTHDATAEDPCQVHWLDSVPYPASTQPGFTSQLHDRYESR